jgi:hypothetical protein
VAARRPAQVWDTDRLYEVMQRLDEVLSAYVAQCYEAAARAQHPIHREYWELEADIAERTKSQYVMTLQLWIDYAAGKHISLME